ncbi:nitrite reductase small subunit NirD [Pseudomonas ogarae]|uniref:nitrite reductase small subunit NirD n=1 Tax=Pseudomonas ogarae (strain DSM 112162 / CECT 30235 / F113) TaxID=1114970 RepID=UPI001644578A|nr:nitrite reductase small subunit NirD [Pseudomonas zarinae]QXH92383.1 nitrite reductase small subunit NirD [Pseudomonas zarinae]
MSQSNVVRIPARNVAQEPLQWRALCSRDDLVPNSGVVAWHDGSQVALLYLPEHQDKPLYAIDNRDPKSGANVIGRGLLGSIKGDLVIASPMYKQHFRLEDGHCLEYPEQSLRVWAVRLNGDVVEIGED